jgi:transcriptional regulator with XRE-family HTH domain
MNRQLSIPDGAEQWLINLIELKNRTDISIKQIAEKENLSEKSVYNVFLGKSKNPGVDLIRRIIHALGGSWREIFGESDAVIGSQDLVTLQAEVDKLTKEKAALQAEVDKLTEENAILSNILSDLKADIAVQKEKVSCLEKENEILQLKLVHKEEIISLHNYYNKLKPMSCEKKAARQ